MASKSKGKAKSGTACPPASVTRLPTMKTKGGTQRAPVPTVPRVPSVAATSHPAADVGAGRPVVLGSCEIVSLMELPTSALAAGFLAWMREHRLSGREWTVDDLWYIAEEDFAVALNFSLPPRRVFLGALQKLPGVQVQYDRRVYDRQGILLRKTTFYRFTPTAEAVPGKSSADLPLFATAA